MAGKSQTSTWAQVGPAPIILFHGKEDALAMRGIDRVRTQLKNAHPDLEMHDIVGSSYTAGTLLTLASPSLFGEPRLIRIDGLESGTDALVVDLKKYADAIELDTTVIVRHRGGNRGSGAVTALKKNPNCVVVDCAEVKVNEKPQFVQQIAQAAGARIAADAVRELCQAFADNLAELAATVEQLATDHDGRITLDAVTRLTDGRVEVSGFKVADAACAGRAAEALALYRHALHTGVNPNAILGALNMKVRQLANVYRAPGTPAEIAKRIGAAPWMVQNAQRDARAWGESALAEAIDMAAETEWLVRGGSHDHEGSVEAYILFIATRGKG